MRRDKVYMGGVSSWADIFNCSVDLMTPNDIEITYDIEFKKYNLDVELIYQFENGLEGQKIYLKSLLDKFTEWIVNRSVDIRNLSPISKLHKQIDFNGDYYIEADNVEGLYSEFLWSVEEFNRR